MEVHHHSHTQRKKWTHYFWEFFMLFLAVSLGFFVENQREYRIEQKRARDFATTLYNEVKSDTKVLAENLHRTEIAYTSLDTLISLLSVPIQQTSTGMLYYYSGLGMFNNFFTSSTATDAGRLIFMVSK